jgi:hypothetical protein
MMSYMTTFMINRMTRLFPKTSNLLLIRSQLWSKETREVVKEVIKEVIGSPV